MGPTSLPVPAEPAKEEEAGGGVEGGSAECVLEGGGAEGTASGEVGATAVEDGNDCEHSSSSCLPLRQYQVDVCEAALRRNTIAVLQAREEKTWIAVKLLKQFGKDVKASSEKKLIVFLAPTVKLVYQHHDVIRNQTDLDVGLYCGAREVDKWSAECWQKEISDHQVLVMTPMILLDALKKAFLMLKMVHFIIFDECLQATGNHPYTKIMKEFYHNSVHKPHIFGMTISPGITKGVSSSSDCVGQISDIECTLDCQIFTVPHKFDCKRFVPSAKEGNRYYDSKLSLHDGLKAEIGLCWLKFDTLMANLKSTQSAEYQDTDDAIEASRSQLSSYRAKIAHCMDELGLICANEAVNLFTQNVSASSSGECDLTKLALLQPNSFLEEVSNKIQQILPHEHERLLRTEIGSLEAVKMGFISPKLFELMRIFQSLGGDSEQVLCLIFMERFITAKITARFIKKVGFLSHLNAACLADDNSSMDGLPFRVQKEKETLKLFHSGKVNLLFVTNVAEKHCSPKCSYVVHFDLPKTVHTYIESHGQARQADSHYIIMLERGNVQQKDLLIDIVRSKHSLVDAASNTEHDAPVFLPDVKDKADACLIESTGPIVPIDSSVSLIYSEELSRDKYSTPNPLFESPPFDGSILRPNAAPSTLVDLNEKSLHIAEQLVHSNASNKLHRIGIFNDHHLSCTEPTGQPKTADPVLENLQSTLGAGTTKRKELHGSAAIKALFGTWASIQDGVTLQGYKIIFNCNQRGQKYSHFVLLIDAVLESDVSHAEVELNLIGKVVKSSFSPCGSITLTAEQVDHAKLFHEFFFNGLFGKLFIGSKSSGTQRRFMLDPENRLPWNSSSMYLLLPIDASSTSDPGILILNWKAVRASTHVVDFMRNVHLSGSHNSLASSTHTCDAEHGRSDEFVHFADKSVLSTDIKDMVVFSIHTGKIYVVLCVESDISANSAFDDLSAGYSSFTDYFRKKYDIVLQHPEQPLLRLKHSHNPHNLLSSNSMVEGPSSSKTANKPRSYVRMPPELLVCVDIPLDILRSFYLLPSLMYRFESLMLACQLKEEIGSTCPVSSLLILEAITTCRCCENFSLERLEFLGDSVLKYAVSCNLFLKYPQMGEGQLTTCRSRAVRNATLHKLGTDSNLQGYIRDAAFVPRHWLAPGQACLWPVHCKCDVDIKKVPMKIKFEEDGTIIGKFCDKGHRWLCSKTIADCVEALIGAYYVGGGLNAALYFMKWLGVDVVTEAIWFEEVLKASSLRSYCSKLEDLELLESKLKYTFSVRGLLLEALTHSSMQELGGCYCYQRLEFLGDSILDLLITWHLFKCHSNIGPGELTDLRSASVSNQNFARVAMSNKFHHHIQHGSDVLLEQITGYAKSIEDHDGRCSLLQTGTSNVPKVLGDIIESIAGALFIDSNLDLDKVWEIFEPLLSPLATPDDLELPPLRELTELCSSCGYFVDTTCSNQGDIIIAELKIQLENSLLVRQGSDTNRKAAKASAAILLLKDLKVVITGKKALHARSASKRKQSDSADVKVDACILSMQHELKESSATKKTKKFTDSCGNLEDPSPCGENFRSDEPKVHCHSKDSLPVSLAVKMQKGGPRTALHQLCQKLLWPLPSFELKGPKASADEGSGKRKGPIVFLSKFKLCPPDSDAIEVTGEARSDKKSSQDSAALLMLYELQKQGRCVIKEL